MSPTRGWAPKGERLVCTVPHGHWHTTTFLCGLRTTGLVAPLVLDSRHLHAKRSEAHLPGPLIPVPGADHFTIVHELRDADGILTRQALLLV